jgi:hypothetical protein
MTVSELRELKRMSAGLSDKSPRFPWPLNVSSGETGECPAMGAGLSLAVTNGELIREKIAVPL